MQSNFPEADLPSGFPEPIAPIAPILSRYTFGYDAKYKYPTLMDLPYKLDVTSGRAAIALALIHGKIGVDHEVLAPAFHCESMIEPIRYVGAQPVFYSICKTTQVDLEKCEALITDKTKAIIVTHYFGFPQELERIRAFCKNHSLILIEDCAHCIFGSDQSKTIGTTGDYAIASTMKFFPVYDGGMLVSSKHDLSSIKLSTCSASFDLKSALTILERSVRMGRFGIAGKIFLALANMKDTLWQFVKRTLLSGEKLEIAPGSAEGGFAFDAKWLHISASKSSLAIINKTNMQRVVELRRERYQHYLNELNGLPGLSFLHSELPNTVVPLIVPIAFDNVQEVFITLKNKGVPIWRFGEFLDAEITSEVCEQSLAFSSNLLQFPCHQELTDNELTWIISQIKLALKGTQGYSNL